MRPIAVLLTAAALACTACHSRAGWFESDPTLALGPGVPDCPSRSRWPAYFGTPGEIPQTDSRGLATFRASELTVVHAAPKRPPSPGSPPVPPAPPPRIRALEPSPR